MGWPQWFVLVVMVATLVYLAAKEVRDRSKSSAVATAAVIGMLAWEGFYAWVLHAGGFW